MITLSSMPHQIYTQVRAHNGRRRTAQRVNRRRCAAWRTVQPCGLPSRRSTHPGDWHGDVVGLACGPPAGLGGSCGHAAGEVLVSLTAA